MGAGLSSAGVERVVAEVSALPLRPASAGPTKSELAYLEHIIAERGEKLPRRGWSTVIAWARVTVVGYRKGTPREVLLEAFRRAPAAKRVELDLSLGDQGMRAFARAASSNGDARRAAREALTALAALIRERAEAGLAVLPAEAPLLERAAHAVIQARAAWGRPPIDAGTEADVDRRRRAAARRAILDALDQSGPERARVETRRTGGINDTTPTGRAYLALSDLLGVPDGTIRRVLSSR